MSTEIAPVESENPEVEAGDGDIGFSRRPGDGSDDLESLPDMPLPNIFRCKKGHMQLGPNETKLVNRWNNAVELTTGPVCHACYFAYMGKKFRTADTGVQAEITLADA